MKKLVFGILALSFVFTSCFKSPKCEYDPCLNAATQADITALQQYIDTNSIVATRHCSGVFYRIESVGTGKTPTACSDVTVQYKGYLIDGTVFDQSTSPVTFNLGMLIPGWKNTLPLISSGGRIVIYVPPSLGYGSQVNGPIPANSILVFEIDLIDVP
ncbi:MAG: FKBP-type peptidyl-prolyl cis-trans isomerase [Bacteroidetes bacterium]|nr:FKBP-type peptidyl-prolyl cis-trans isomerase [Bacteroidota bacterium]